MARKRTLDDGPVLKGQIMEAAASLFYQRGYAATSIRDIADAVGISSSTMYHHFKNKQEILYAIVTRFMTDFTSATVKVLRDPLRDAADRLRETIKIHIEMSDDRRPELLIGNPIRYALDPEQKRDGVRLQAAYHDAVRDTIAEGVREGAFDVTDTEITTMAILDMLNGIREWFDPRRELSRDDLIDQYTMLIFTMLGASPAPRARHTTFTPRATTD